MKLPLVLALALVLLASGGARAQSISDDGSRIVVDIEVSNGGREGSSATQVFDRAGNIVETLWRSHGDMDTAETRASLEAAATKYLAALEHRHHLIPMTGAPTEGPDGDPHPTAVQFSTAAGPVRVGLANAGRKRGVLTVRVGRRVLRRFDPDWRVAPSTAESAAIDTAVARGGTACFNAARIEAVAYDLERRAVVVRVGHAGSDSCWEGPDSFAVVTW